MEIDVLLNEQKNFIETLHGTHHMGSIIKCSFKDKQPSVKPLASCVPKKLISAENNGNTYITVNRFAGNRRLSNKIFCYNGFFIDLDAHNSSDEEIAKKKINTIALLKEAISNNEICNYTMLIDSGRGLGLYFVMPKSIAGFGDTEKQIRFFKAIYKKLANKIANILRDKDTLDVDKSVLDGTRLCRLPGTYNYEAHTYCRLLELNKDAKYTLTEIADICGFVYAGKKTKKYNKKSIEEFAVKRMENLIALRDSRTAWSTKHHTLCFIFFHTAILVMPLEDAIIALEEFNNGFADYSISNNEIKGIIASAKNGNYAYKITNQYIIDRLDLSKDETFAFFFESKESKEAKHKKVITERIDRDKVVVQAILKCDTYNEVVLLTKVPLRTVKRIAKKYDCGHTKGSIKDFSEIDWNTAYESELFLKNKKSAKKSYVDVNETNLPNKTASEPTTFNVDGIDFDIIEEDFSNSPVVDEDKYGYGLSFLEYLRTMLPENRANNMKQMKTYIYDYANADMQEKVCKALNQIAKAYETNTSVNAAYFDIMHIAKAVTNGHFSFIIRGMKASLEKNEAEYPDTFVPTKNIDEIYAELTNDFELCSCDKEMLTAINHVRVMYDKLRTTKGWEYFSCNGHIVCRDEFINKLLHANEYTICKIINKVARFIHKRKYRPSYVDCRRIFCEYLFNAR